MPKKERKESHKWTNDESAALIENVKASWPKVFSQAVVVTGEWNKRIYDTLNALDNDQDHLLVPHTLTGESCKSKWKALSGPVTAHAKTIKGDTGTGSATVDPPPYYNDIVRILGHSSAVNGPYSSRTLLTSGRIDCPVIEQEEPKSDTPMTQFAAQYDAEKAGDASNNWDMLMNGFDQDVETAVDEGDISETGDESTTETNSNNVVSNQNEMGHSDKAQKRGNPGSGASGSKKQKIKDAAGAKLKVMMEKQQDSVLESPKPPKTKKEAKARAGGMSEFQVQYLGLMGAANELSGESLAVMKQSAAVQVEALRQQGLEMDKRRNESSTAVAIESAKFLAILEAMKQGSSNK
ncbi:hypothetical protein BDR26DRAFT_914198 [Obelidium mucronatum]|nr:hypothetical protein BDR26DRAFT_914198 [Obelidium mucronatum]